MQPTWQDLFLWINWNFRHFHLPWDSDIWCMWCIQQGQKTKKKVGIAFEKLTVQLALLKTIPNRKSPKVIPPISPLRVSVACSIPPNFSTTNTNTNESTPNLKKNSSFETFLSWVAKTENSLRIARAHDFDSLILKNKIVKQSNHVESLKESHIQNTLK